MEKRTMQLLVRAIITLLIVLITEGHPVDITYLQSAVAKGAVCLDGSPPAYHFDKGFGDGVNNWFIQLEGGAWCNNATTCLARTKTRLGSSNLMVKTVSFSGILSNKAKFNPDFYDWNRIRIRYCDGASFTGDVEAVDPKTKVFYRGARIFSAVMEDLLAKGMKNAQNAILAGCSAGGLAAILHCDRFKGLLPPGANVNVSQMLVSLSIRRLFPVPLISNRSTVKLLIHMHVYFNLYHLRLWFREEFASIVYVKTETGIVFFPTKRCATNSDTTFPSKCSL